MIEKNTLDPPSRGFDDYWVAAMTSGTVNMDLEGNASASEEIL